MDLSIVIVSWNVKDLLEKCLSSIVTTQGNLKLEIFVVDNASTDGTVGMVQKKFPTVAVIANKKNVGFATANNQAIQKSRGRYVLALNPDTELFDTTLQTAIAFMDQHQNVGIVGCKHLNPDGTTQPSVRQLPTVLPILYIATKITKLFTPKSVSHYLAENFDYDKTQAVEQVAGSFLLIRRAVIDSIGSFDERFFIWFEEVDLCKRVISHWTVYYLAEAQITHYGGQSFKQQLVVKNQINFFKSAWRYFRKHGFIW